MTKSKNANKKKTTLDGTSRNGSIASGTEDLGDGPPPAPEPGEATFDSTLTSLPDSEPSATADGEQVVPTSPPGPVNTTATAVIGPPNSGSKEKTNPPATAPPRNQRDFARQVLEGLTALAQDSHARYNTLDDQLQVALQWQEQIHEQLNLANQRVEAIQAKARASRLVLDNNLGQIREAVDDLTSDGTPRQSARERTPPSIEDGPPPKEEDVVSYASPVPPRVREVSPRLKLFRPRSPAEDTAAYNDRRNEQEYVLAREHYEDGVRVRNANAEKLWKELGENRRKDGWDSDEGEHHVNYQTQAGGGPPGDDGDDDPSHKSSRPSSDHGAGGPHRRPPSRASKEESARNHMDDPAAGEWIYTDNGSSRPPKTLDAGRGRRPAAPAPPRRSPMYTRGPSYLPELREQDYYLNPDRDDPNASYIDRQLEIIRAAICERIAREHPDIPAAKNLKNIPAPEKYQGEDDAEAFMGWLKAFLRWLALGRITGPDLDDYRVQILGQYLVKEARAWYDDVIDSIDGVGRYWNFEQAMCALYKRFIHKSTARSAADKFYHVKYRRETGVSGLWDTMIALARKMPELPDNYSFKTTFLEALPEEIVAPMLRNRNISVERSEPWELRQAALLQEDSNRVLEEHRSARCAPNTREGDRNMRPGDRTQPPHRALNQSPRTGLGERPNDRARPAGGDYRPQTLAPNAARPTADRRPLTQSRPNYSTHASATAPRAAAAAVNSTDRSKVQCYNCKEYGHMAAQCLKAQAPRLRAARVMEDGGSPQEGQMGPTENGGGEPLPLQEADPDSPGEVPEDIEQPLDEVKSPEVDEAEYGVDGSQYDPDAGYATAYSDFEEDAQWFGSMRVVPDEGDSEGSSVSDGTHDQSDEGSRVVDTENDQHRSDIVMSDFVRLTIESDIASLSPRPIPMGSMVSLAIFQPLDGQPAVDEEDYSDMPPLEPNPDVDAFGDAFSVITQGVQAFVDDPSPREYHGPVIELPLNEDFDWAWAQFVESNRTNEDLEQVLMILYRMLAQNNHMFRQLADARNRVDALSDSLSWTRRELAAALFREGEGLTIRRHLSMAEGQRARIRARVLQETDPLSADIEDENDDPRPNLTLAEANDVLLRVVEGRDIPPEAGLNPPDYDRVCRHDVWFGAMTTTPSTDNLECIVLLLTINGLGALTLCDAGSTTEMVSNDFARVANCDVIKLENPATLQLGCAGSRSRINYGTRAPVTLGQFGADVYFDIANLDRYDAVLGTPFLRRFGVSLDFRRNCVIIDGHAYPSLSRTQVNEVLHQRGTGRTIRERPVANGTPPAPPVPRPTP
ncbi:hypothetical protein VTO73DRAFT_13089 [Trametes versicolor]